MDVQRADEDLGPRGVQGLAAAGQLLVQMLAGQRQSRCHVGDPLMDLGQVLDHPPRLVRFPPQRLLLDRCRRRSRLCLAEPTGCLARADDGFLKARRSLAAAAHNIDMRGQSRGRCLRQPQCGKNADEQSRLVQLRVPVRRRQGITGIGQGLAGRNGIPTRDLGGVLGRAAALSRDRQPGSCPCGFLGPPFVLGDLVLEAPHFGEGRLKGRSCCGPVGLAEFLELTEDVGRRVPPRSGAVRIPG